MTPLDGLVRRMIAQDGPMPVAQFMALALQHPDHGYYRQAAPIGRAGDFITAPEISQVFGELVGLWLASAWDQASQPKRCYLVDAGPGRGVLMVDALRAAKRTMPDFAKAAMLYLLESNHTLRAVQDQALSDVYPYWVDSLDSIPNGQLFLVANEFLDALPVQQLVMTEQGWRERVVGCDAEERLFFAAGGDPTGSLMAAGLRVPPDAGIGDIHEVQPVALAFVRELAERLASRRGAALIVDYAATPSSEGKAGRSTLRGIRGHRLVDPLSKLGETDLTVDVDFAAIASVAREAGAAVHGPVPQGEFLQALGVEARRAALKRSATPEQAVEIDTAIDRLVDPAAMGTVFKAMAIATPSLRVLPGFPA